MNILASHQWVYRLISRRHLLLAAAWLVVNGLVFGLTDPFSSVALIVIIGFLVAAANLLLGIAGLWYLVILLIPAVKQYRRRLTVLSWGFLTVLLALSSIGQLSIRDIIVVLAVGAVGYFYSLYFRLDGKTKS